MGKVLRVESVQFKRTKTGPWEDGMICNEGDGPIIDMDGKVVPLPLHDWRSTHRYVMELRPE